jgi:hypothetical protein
VNRFGDNAIGFCVLKSAYHDGSPRSRDRRVLVFEDDGYRILGAVIDDGG